MNTVTLTGRIVEELEPDTYSAGERSGTVARFTLAVDRPRKDAETDFIPVVTFDALATTCAEHIGRGHLVGVVGRLRQSRWTTPEGENRSRIEVVADQVDFLARPRHDAD